MAEAAAAAKTDTGTAAAATTTSATTTAGNGAAGTGAAAAAQTATTQTTTTAAAVDKTAAASNDQKGYWPEGWQARIAGGDEKELKQLSRYASVEDIWKKARSLEQRLSSGEYKAALPKDPKPEELAAWRKDNGIPEAADKYDLKGLKIPDSDKEIVSGIVSRLHAQNATPAVVREAVQAYYDQQETQSQARAQKDDEQRHAALDALNGEWGGSFRRNVNLIEGTILSRFPEDVRGLVKSARLPDGTALFNSVPALKALAALALELNPAGIVAPAGSSDIAKPALEEYQDLQKFMREKRSAYNKDQVKQNRMGELIQYLSKNELIDGHGNVIVKKKAA